MTEPVQLKYQTKDGAERIVLLPTIDIDAPDMLALLAGVIISQHDQIVKMNRRIEALERDVYAAPEAEAQIPGTEPEPDAADMPEVEAAPEAEAQIPGTEPEPDAADMPEVEAVPKGWPESEFRKKN